MKVKPQYLDGQGRKIESAAERAALRAQCRLVVYQGHNHAVCCDGKFHAARSWAWSGLLPKGPCWCEDLGGPGWDGKL